MRGIDQNCQPQRVDVELDRHEMHRPARRAADRAGPVERRGGGQDGDYRAARAAAAVRCKADKNINERRRDSLPHRGL